jgi:phosphatidate cytidylyltransferase
VLKQRVITALVLVAALFAAIFWLSPLYFDGVITLVVIAAAWEWTSLSGIKSLWPRLLYVLSIAAIGMSLLQFSTGSHATLFTASLLWWLFAWGCLLRYPKPNVLIKQPWFLLLAGCCVLLPSWLAFHYLQQLSDRVFYLLWFIALVAAADIGAYFAGKAFGKHKLAPAVSPNKTIEGLVGGVVTTIVVAELGITLLAPATLPKSNLLLVAGAALVLAVLSVVGDLFESLLKRQQQLKDSGSLLPGHGGVMDRMDSMTAAVPLYALLVHALIGVA